MSLTKFPNGVSSYGLPVIGGAHVTTGNIFFVDSNTGSGSYDGRDKDHPFGTVTQALAKCTANRGDIIYVMPGHLESADVNVNKAGVSIIGLGHGGLRPRFQLTTSDGTSGSMEISSCDVMVENIVWYSTVDALVRAVEVNADHFTALNCEWLQNKTSQNPLIVIGAASTAENMTIDGLRALCPSTTTVMTGISIKNEGSGGHVIRNCWIMGMSAMNGLIATNCSNSPIEMLIENNVLITHSASTGVGASLIGLSTGQGSGMIVGNYMANRVGTTTGLEWGGATPTDATFDYGFYKNLIAINSGVRGSSTYADATPITSA